MHTGDRAERQVRAANNQSLFRTVNERVEELNESFRALVPSGDWVCECADEGCLERVPLTLEEYEHVRANGARFLVAPEHVYPDVERVVEKFEQYWIVEKIEDAATVAVEEDPRR